MSVRFEFGKITSIRVGFGGYQDAMFGVGIGLGGDGWGFGDWKGPWARWHEGCKWTTEDQARSWATVMQYLMELCEAAKVQTVDRLQGVPVEVTFDDGVLKSWRVLTEVI